MSRLASSTTDLTEEDPVLLREMVRVPHCRQAGEREDRLAVQTVDGGAWHLHPSLKYRVSSIQD